PVMHVLQTGDRSVSRVIHHHPHDGKAGFHSSGDDGHVAAESPIANQGDSRPFRLRHFYPEYGSGTEPHRRQTAWGDECSRNGDRKLLSDAVLVPTDICDDKAVRGNGLPNFAQYALRAHGKLIRVPLVSPIRGERAATFDNLLTQFSTVAMRQTFC